MGFGIKPMQVQLENDGERKTVIVNQAGTVYVSKDLAGEEIEIAYEVTE